MNLEHLQELHVHFCTRYGGAQSADERAELSAARQFIEHEIAKWNRLCNLAEAGRIAGGEAPFLFRPSMRHHSTMRNKPS
jgi:hypothetical protein